MGSLLAPLLASAGRAVVRCHVLRPGPILLLNDVTAADAPARLASLPFVEHDLVTFAYIELTDTSPA